jgi:hypothetical protein
LPEPGGEEVEYCDRPYLHPKDGPFGRLASCTSGIYLGAAVAATLLGMSRPPVQTNVGKAAGSLLLLLGLAILVGCQGVSAGGNSQQQISSLAFGTTTVDFGNVAAGSSKTLSVTATNSGTQTVTISSAAISTKYFTLIAPSLPASIAAGQSVSIRVKFTPNAAGKFSATANVTSDASSAATSITLSGTGTDVGQLDLNPASEDFGSVSVGAKQSQTVTLTNNTAANVNISQASVSGTGFQLSGITTPLTLNVSESTTFTVAFAPQAAGSASGAVAILSDAPNSTLTMGLSGVGTAAPGALGSNPTSLSFGSVVVGNKSTLSETVTNTGGASVTISAVGISGTGFTLSGITAPVTLAGGQSATFNVSFTPQSAGATSGNVTITSNASNPSLTIPLSGTGTAAGALGSNPTSLSFGSLLVGNKSTLSETVTNTGGSSVTISAVGISGTGFSMSGIAAPVTLTAGQGATFSVSFAPTAAGTVSGNVTITSNASNPTLTIPLSGTGTAVAGQLSVSPTTLALGSVPVGTSGTASGSLTASGANVTVTAATTNNSVFSVGGLSLPVTIPVGNSVPFTVTFSPVTTGAVSATLTFLSDAQPSTTTETLTGTGTPASTHTVNLSWNASTSSNISGYNIYRAVYTNPQCGSFSKINATLNTGLLYTDATVVNGTSYCYATTAVDTSNAESGYSNIVSNLQIP